MAVTFFAIFGVLLIKNRGFFYKSKKYTIVPMEYYLGCVAYFGSKVSRPEMIDVT